MYTRTHELLAFQDLIEDHSQRTGLELPTPLHVYLAQLLAHGLSHTPMLSPPAIADRCLWPGDDHQGIKHYADHCLLWSAITDQNHMTQVFWTHQGSQAYAHYAQVTGDHRFHQLAAWFAVLQNFMATMSRWDHGDSTWQITQPLLLNTSNNAGNFHTCESTK